MADEISIRTDPMKKLIYQKPLRDSAAAFFILAHLRSWPKSRSLDMLRTGRVTHGKWRAGHGVLDTVRKFLNSLVTNHFPGAGSRQGGCSGARVIKSKSANHLSGGR